MAEIICAQQGVVRKAKRKCKHGGYGHPLFNHWKCMIQRCYSESNHSYMNYGGRGITVCKEWVSNPLQFFADMQPGFSAGLTLERNNTNLGYSKSNCRWATMLEQQNNRRNNIRITRGGRTMTVAQWARELGICKHTIYVRLKRGWSKDDALNTPR